MEMKEFQETIKKFDDARGWESNWNLKDLCLNINEEIGELWNLIKWVDNGKQKEIISNNKEEADNFIGDVLFIILKMFRLKKQCLCNMKKTQQLSNTILKLKNQ